MALYSRIAWATAGLGGAMMAPIAFAEKDDVVEEEEKPKSKGKRAKDNEKFFDPDALERGAKALREIQKSPYAKQALEVTRQQEVTKQAEHKEREAKAQAHAAQLMKEREQVRYQEEAKLEENRAQIGARMKQYEDELARKRMMAEHELTRQRNAETVKLTEDATGRAEQQRLNIERQIQAERRAAEQYAADLQKQVQRERALAEAEGRIKEGRENEDIARRAQLLKYQEAAKKSLESINAVMSQVGVALTDLLTDRNKLIATVGVSTALFLGLYGAREGTRVIGRAVDRYLGTPNLVRETSVVNYLNPKSWLGMMRPTALKSADEVKKDFSDIVLAGNLHNNVRSMAASASNTRIHGAPFRHMLFYGPPGTGKTMAAKRLARTSGMDYAIMSGGDVAPLGGKAVTQLHQMFDWAQTSRRGLLLFIDEADAFLGRRGDGMSEGLRGSLNALLYRTGDQSKDFMVVLATNRPGDLDDAVLDRMDEALEFALPGLEERKRILSIYLDQYVRNTATAAPVGIFARIGSMLRGQKASSDAIEIRGVDDAAITKVAAATAGFSGRELAKMMAAVQASVYGASEAVLTPAILDAVVSRKMFEHRERQAFREGAHGTGGIFASAAPAK